MKKSFITSGQIITRSPFNWNVSLNDELRIKVKEFSYLAPNCFQGRTAGCYFLFQSSTAGVSVESLFHIFLW